MAGSLSELVSSVQVAVELEPATFNMSTRAVFYIVANHDVVNQALQASLDLRYQDFKTRFSTFSAVVRCCTTPAVHFPRHSTAFHHVLRKSHLCTFH